MSTPTVDPSDLALFAHVADAGSFSKAADRLNLPKSTVSRRLSALESLLGERLMLRTTRRLTVTEFGAAVLEHARQVVAEVDSTLALAQHRQAEPSGVLRVSLPGDVAMLVLGNAIADFALRHPKVTLELDLSPRKVDLMAENVDLAVRMGELSDDAHMGARRLVTFHGALYASPAWAEAHAQLTHPSELVGERCALHALVLGARAGEPPPWSLSWRDQNGGLEVWTGLPTRRTLANSPAMLLQLAAAGLGVTAVADFFAYPYLRNGTLVQVLPGWTLPPVPAWAVFPERRLMPAKTRAFIDTLVNALAPCREHEAAASLRHALPALRPVAEPLPPPAAATAMAAAPQLEQTP
ncbi:LysR family transcriptional regulator [Ideonella azotifigens]|uniref:LysR family transcriptional regulator n=2 Tax=Ideonella azotifigens TaxID=513160 RepID=A0ABN1JPL6_9BURK|nr:LysR family transcriptional regulator [Ideonella azotifigens]MCD2340080.1 LysR family transcriptional regulator [Ideonella azotifigens]